METLALRYAEALLSIAVDENKNALYRLHVEEIYSTILECEDLKKVLSSSFISKQEKLDLFKEILKDEELIYVRDFILLIISSSRENFLLEILKEFIRISNLEDGIIEGIVYSTQFLNKEELNRIKLAVEKKLNKKVMLKNRIDNTLIGGIKVIIDDYNFDGSIKNKLQQLHRHLKEEA